MLLSRSTHACFASFVTACAIGAAAPGPRASDAETADRGFAVLATKILTASTDAERPAVVDNGVLLVDAVGTIVAVGERDRVDVPAGWPIVDVRPSWLAPSFIELHNHIAFDGGGLVANATAVNDTVYLTNPGLRASANIEPDNALQRRGVAGGVTTVLYIPGSGSNIGGQGVLLKLGVDEWEEKVVRDPGSMKLAQAGNPEDWTVGVGRAFMNWNTRDTIRRGRRYHEAWRDWERGEGERPRRDIQWDVFRDLFAKETQVSTHTQGYQVVLATITMVREELGLDVYIDHGSFDGYRTAPHAERAGVPAILGPRAISVHYPSNRIDQDGKIVGMAAEYQTGGHTQIGFNTDCVDGTGGLTPPQEELSLQAAMALRYGMRNENLEALRGLTSAPAEACGLADRIGSLESGKEADFLVLDGDPADPRTTIERVYVHGELVYDAADGRRW